MSETKRPFLSRWSRLKQRSREAQAEVAPSPLPLAASGDLPNPLGEDASAEPAGVLPTESTPVARTEGEKVALAALESLTPQSDFRPFMQAGIDAATRNGALKRLFADPHFSVMDGLDVYIDDYGKSEPIPPALLARLMKLHSIDPFAEAEEIASDDPVIPVVDVPDPRAAASVPLPSITPAIAASAAREPTPPTPPEEATE